MHLGENILESLPGRGWEAPAHEQLTSHWRDNVESHTDADGWVYDEERHGHPILPSQEVQGAWPFKALITIFVELAAQTQAMRAELRIATSSLLPRLSACPVCSVPVSPSFSVIHVLEPCLVLRLGSMCCRQRAQDAEEIRQLRQQLEETRSLARRTSVPETHSAVVASHARRGGVWSCGGGGGGDGGDGGG
eukprot:872982-Pleurochrysis_carterae.AAC.8